MSPTMAVTASSVAAVAWSRIARAYGGICTAELLLSLRCGLIEHFAVVVVEPAFGMQCLDLALQGLQLRRGPGLLNPGHAFSEMPTGGLVPLRLDGTALLPAAGLSD